ncbi:hypothetical protein FAES_4893 [Fibrella aestuarina BUZ 2]|uniref:GmrSD restriction endonucleases N-terminal domain-containing protein n=1 Tax=Fibrella aestuarina BUZ 2 TaxID=1166018 RepID=I0KFI9_9BACT|nr:DUF262 domain-containing protein [Fibrella aestuarina]CCH02892.1 hypothetical protein FAES_4893 [Fibrella aestuarina BUZ 2]
MSFQTPITIREAVENIHSRKYFLPAIQREFVWKPERIERLFDSIMQGFPINSFLFWQVKYENRYDYQFYEFIKDYTEEIGEHNEKANLASLNGDFTAILDGQQRLTSFYIGLMGSYGERYYKTRKGVKANYFKRELYLNISSLSNDESGKYQFQFLTKDKADVRGDDMFWYKVSDILKINDLTDINNYIHEKQLNASKEPFSILYRLYEAVNKTQLINFFLEKSTELDKVLNIFIRINSGGVNLSYSDMLFSTAAAQWLKKDAREEINRLYDELRSLGFWGITKDWILKACLYLADINDIRFKVDNFNRVNMSKIEDQWDMIKVSLLRTVALANRFGFDYSNIYSYNAFLPIAYYLHNYQHDPSFKTSTHYRDKREEILKWINITILKRTFSGQTDALLIYFRKSIKEKKDFDFSSLKDSVKNTSRNLSFNSEEISSLLWTSYGDRGVYNLLSVIYGNPDFDIKPHLDHIHPRNTVSYSYSSNTVVNLQLLAGQENIEKQDKPFNEWLKINFPENRKQVEFKVRHFIPECDLSPENFKEFSELRRQLLESRLREIV